MTNAMTDVNGILKIDQIPLGAGRIGLCHCPGRRGLDGAGRLWSRDLDADVGAIRHWGADLLVTLIEEKEFALYGVQDLQDSARRVGLDWIHWPVEDMGTAEGEAGRRMAEALPELAARISNGAHVSVHCAAGLGRTGTLVAQVLVAAGMSPDAAIRRVRAARPGAIETQAQEEAVRAFAETVPA